jgi:LmbE family N-acetylglucosaminyl deacetylase
MFPFRSSRLWIAAAILAATAGPVAPASVPSAFEPLDFDRGASGLGLALRRVGTTARVLYVTAHPDDEHNGILVRLSRGLGVRTALLTVTRGEGGQNAIGPELFDALGVLRTGELMALHRWDGVEQYFGRAYEFGFSFSVEETFDKWGREETLGDIVRVIRSFRPDVILTLPLQGEGGGQHHFAAAQLAQAAFRVAADPARFADQRLAPWQALKLYEGGIGGFGGSAETAVRVPTFEYDPLLGMSWQELGARSRTMHRSQGTSQLTTDLPPAEGRFRLVDAEPAVSRREADFLDGVDTALGGLRRFAPGDEPLAARLASLQASAEAARAAFDARKPEAAVPALASYLADVRALRGELGHLVPDERGRSEIDSRLLDEEGDAGDALARAHGLRLEASCDDGLVTPGQAVAVTVALANEAERPLEVSALELEAPAGWAVERRDAAPASLAGGASGRARFIVTLPADAWPSQPYWRKIEGRDRHELLVSADESLPWSPAPVTARARLAIAGVATRLEAPVVFRYEGRVVGGERRHALTVVPELSVRLTPDVAAVPLAGPRRPLELRAAVRSYSKQASPAEVRLELPEGFSAEPKSARLSFAVEGEEAVARFQVTPPALLKPGELRLKAVAEREGRPSREYVQAIDYDHVERRQLLRPAETRLLVLDVRTAPGTAVGYVMGSGDAIADAIRQLRVPLTLLTADELLFSDLGRFSTIVTGIRAYESRADLRSAQGRLMHFVEAGGHLVVLYNRAGMNRIAPESPAPSAGAPSPYAPYPASVSDSRISDETAPMRLLQPAHPLFTTPNRIGEADWSGWVQERGIQLLAAKDERYQELLAATDPFPYNPGEKRGLLTEARVGRGTWTYVGLALFRQIPAAVPGGWRLLANLVSRPRPAQASSPRPAQASR